MTINPPVAPTPGRTPRPVVWGLGILCLLLLVTAVWVWRTVIGGLAPGDEKPGSPETRPAVQAAEQTARALQEADRDGTLTNQEARSAVSNGGVLTQLQSGEAVTSLSVAFPYAVSPGPHTAALRRYVCVDYQVLEKHTVHTYYRGGCSDHPRPLTSPVTAVS
jgi:hypothetical protein